MAADAGPNRTLLILLGAAGALIMLDQGADLVATLVSQRLDPGAVAWRFGVFGLAVSRTSALVAGDVMLLASLALLGWRTGLRMAGVMHLLVAAALVAGTGSFVLDVLQLRKTIPPAAARQFTLAVARAGAIAIAGIVALVWAGVASIRAARGRSGRHRDRTLVVGRTPDA